MSAKVAAQKLFLRPGLQSLKCEYCGTTQKLIADHDQIPGLEQASLIVPMKVEERQLELTIFEYMAKGEYTPDDMIENSRFVRFERFYAPYYRFSGH